MRGIDNKTGVQYKREIVGTLIGYFTSATGVAGSPGTWDVPAKPGAIPESCKAVISANPTPSPATAWTAGQYVPTVNGVGAHWDGTRWACGSAGAVAIASVPCDKIPSKSSTKAVKLAWLSDAGVEIEDASSLTNAELHAFIVDYCDTP